MPALLQTSSRSRRLFVAVASAAAAMLAAVFVFGSLLTIYPAAAMASPLASPALAASAAASPASAASVTESFWAVNQSNGEYEQLQATPK